MPVPPIEGAELRAELAQPITPYNAQKTMQITFKISLKDFFAAQALHAKRSEISFVGYCTARYFYPFLGVCILAFELTPHPSRGSQNMHLFSIACGIFLILLPVYLYYVTRRAYKRSMSGSGACTVDFSTEFLRTTGEHSKSEIKWSAIRSFSEDKACFLLYLAPARFLILPKRFCSSTQVDELRALFGECVQPQVSEGKNANSPAN